MTYIGSLEGSSSSSSSTSSILSNSNTITGLASGVDTDSIVEAMVESAQVPLVSMLQQRQILMWKQEEYQQVNSALTTLQTSLSSMRLQSTFLSQQTSSSDSSVVTASANGLAANGTYSVTVNNLAQNAMLSSASKLNYSSSDADDTPLAQLNPSVFGSDTSDSFTINGQTITYNPQTDTINSVLQKITSDTDTGVSAFYDASSGYAVLQSSATGSSAQISITGDSIANDSTAGFFYTILGISDTSATGTDASLNINGIDTTSSSNTATFGGVTLDLAGTGSSTVTVSTNTSAIVQTITDFVQTYNQTLQTLQGFYNTEPNSSYQPLTASQESSMTQAQIDEWNQKAQAGLLQFDPMVGNAMNNIKDVASTVLSGLGSSGSTSTSLYDIGIQPIDPMTGVASGDTDPGVTTTGWNTYGLLEINTAQLTQAVEQDPQAVMNLFTNNGSDSTDEGLGDQMYTAVSNAITQITQQAGLATTPLPTTVNSNTGEILLPSTAIDPNGDFTSLFSDDSYDTSFIGEQISTMDKQAEQLQSQISQQQTMWESQFTQMEQAISSLNSEQSELVGMLGDSSS